MPSRAVCYYDRQVYLFLYVLHDGKCIDCAVPMMPGHACSCFDGDREHRLGSSNDRALATDRKTLIPALATRRDLSKMLLLASRSTATAPSRIRLAALRRAGDARVHQSPAPGSGKKNWNLSGFPSRSLESDRGGFLIEMFGQTFA